MLTTFRQSRGFGIHSPFAFALTTQVLRSRDRYYALKELEESVSGSRFFISGDMRCAALLFRLAMYFYPAHINFHGDEVPPCIRESATKALNNITKPGNPDILHYYNIGHEGNDEGLIGSISEGKPFLSVIDMRHTGGDKRKKLISDIVASLPFGMTFLSRERLMIVTALPHLPRQNFKVNVK